MSLKSNFEYIRDWCNHRFLRRDEKVDIDLSNYYTKNEVDSNISSATPDISVSMYSSSGSKSYNQTISNNGQFELSRVATSGSYNDLSDKPTIPAAQVQSDWNATSGMGAILNKPDLSGYMTVEDYQTDEEVVAAALNDLDGRIKTVADDVKANSIPMILVSYADVNLSTHYAYVPAIIYRNDNGFSMEIGVKLSTEQSVTWRFIGIYSRNHSLDYSGEVLSYCQFTVPGTEGYLDTVTGQSATFEIATKHVTEEKTTMFYLCALDNNEMPIAVLPIIVTALPDD